VLKPSLRPLVVLLAALGFAAAASAQTDFVAFESGQVRPLALSPDGTKLFAVNTPDNRLEVFNVVAGVLTRFASIPVGMEPVAVAARTNTEAWVVNHLSDSVSIVDIAATPPRVTRTLLVGDEPRDILFAGTLGRAFITTAHRGQHRTDSSISGVTGAGDPQLTTAGVDRADVWVFNPASLGTTLGGTPVRILTFRADTPRALAKSANGNTVYVAAFHSGNRTTTITETLVCNGFLVSGGTNCPGGSPGGVLPPSTNAALDPAPEAGVIVKFNGTNWLDSGGRNWNARVPFSLPDFDVFPVNADTLTAGTAFPGVGTVLFNMAVHPNNGKVYVTNTEMPNLTRFEGPGIFGGSTVQGHLSESRITVINPTFNGGGTDVTGGTVDARHLNKHINYSLLHTSPGANHTLIDAQAQHSLATPTQPVISSDGSKLYVAAFGSAKIGVFDTATLDNNTFNPSSTSANYIPTVGGGPSGLVLDESNASDHKLYVLTRFDNSLRVIDADSKAMLATIALSNPEPAPVVTGRRFLYDATVSSANGETACASCHIFGDLDDLAWDLGNPDDVVTVNNQPSASGFLPPSTSFHPMKGPMTTQTLRGMATHGGMHWRGDRVDGFFGTDDCNEPVGAPCNEDFSFRNFIVAFEGLLGKHGTITPTQMQQFSDFVLQMMLPPNPVRPLNNTLAGAAASGQTVYMNTTSDTVATCNGCHTLDPALGFFGTRGAQSFEGEPQDAKVPHLRNVYTKVGMFFSAGNQVRGFGLLHDGSVDTVKTFLGATVFNLTATQEDQLQQFMFAFPSDLAPIVGQQVTLTSTNSGVVGPRIDLFETRAGTAFSSLMLGGTVTECDVVVKGTFGSLPRGWRRESGTTPANTIYRNDVNQTITGAALRALVSASNPLTYTCAPPGSGTRMGINQDRDALLDGLDNCPAVANNDQTDTNSNGIGDACETTDTDGDGVLDVNDNCATVANPGQQNFDGDLLGDVCDPDDDNDLLLDVYETNTGTFVSATNTGSNPFDTDTDDDGYPDGLEVNWSSDPNNAASPGVNVPLAGPLGQVLLIAGFVLIGAWALRRRSASAA